MPLEDANAMPLPPTPGPPTTPEPVLVAPTPGPAFIRPFEDKTVGKPFLGTPENQFPGEDGLQLVEKALGFVASGNPSVAVPMLYEAVAKLKKGKP